MQGNETLGLGLWASTCTLSVYWLVNRRSHPTIGHGNRRLGLWGCDTDGGSGDGGRCGGRHDETKEFGDGDEEQDDEMVEGECIVELL